MVAENSRPTAGADSGSVITYARFSSDEQNATSIDDQFESSRGFSKQRGLPAPDRLLKDEGVSVKDGMAPSFKSLLDMVRGGEVRMIFVDEISRISRVTEDILHVQRILRYRRVPLWSVHEGIDITDENADIHVLFAGHKNQAASRDARHRIKRSMDGNIRRGLSNGDVTIGYKSIALTGEEIAERRLPPRGKDNRPYKKIVVDEESAKVVRLIFHLFVDEKKTIRGITRYLNDKKIGRGGKARTNMWLPINVRKTLGSRRYLGYRDRNLTMIVVNPETGGKTQRKQPKEDHIEVHDSALAIVDEALFAAAQKRLDEHRNTYGQHHGNSRKRSGHLLSYAPRQLFSGTFSCGICEANLVQKRAGKVSYYVCPSAQIGLCDNTVQTNRDRAHERVLALIREEAAEFFVHDLVLKLLRLELANKAAAGPDELAGLHKAHQKTQTEIENLTDALASGPNSAAIFDALDAREKEKARLDSEIRAAERRAARPAAAVDIEWVRRNLGEHFEELLAANVTRSALALREITGPIKIFAAQKPWLDVRYPVARFSLDFARMATAIAADRGEFPLGPTDCGYGRELELELRKVPLHEKYADRVVQMRDKLGMTFAAIARELPERMTGATVGIAYRFGMDGDPYGHRNSAKATGGESAASEEDS